MLCLQRRIVSTTGRNAGGLLSEPGNAIVAFVVSSGAGGLDVGGKRAAGGGVDWARPKYGC